MVSLKVVDDTVNVKQHPEVTVGVLEDGKVRTVQKGPTGQNHYSPASVGKHIPQTHPSR